MTLSSFTLLFYYSVQFSSVAQSCPILCDPMDCSTPGFPVHHQLPELAQTHVYPVGDAIQPSGVLECRNHFLHQFSRESESEVAQSCATLCDPVDCSPPGSSVHGILQTRILEWVAISFSRGSSQPRDRTRVSCIAGRRFTVWATRESTEELYKKDMHNPDNHDGVITHLEPDILECEVKWALGSITMNKASGGEELQLSCFKS